MLRQMVAAVAVGLLSAGCSTPPGRGAAPFHGVRPAPAGDYISGHVVAGKIYDIEGVLHNYSPTRVQLASLRLLSPTGPGIRVLNVRAYLLSQTGGIGDIDEGDLPKNCPELYKPYPVTDVAVAPRSSSDWVIVIALIFRKPGRYHFGKLRIGYITAGKAGWQDYYIRNLNLTAIPQSAAPPHLYSPTRCSRYIAPVVGYYDAYNAGHGGWAGGLLYANGNISRGLSVAWLRTPDGRYFKEKVAGGTWQRSGDTVSLCLSLVGASPGAPATDRMCARGVPITRTPVRAIDAHGAATLVRVSWIPGSS